MSTEVRMLLKARDVAYRSEEEASLRKVTARLSQAIKATKRTHTHRI